jgi:hypothetical protein
MYHGRENVKIDHGVKKDHGIKVNEFFSIFFILFSLWYSLGIYHVGEKKEKMTME